MPLPRRGSTVLRGISVKPPPRIRRAAVAAPEQVLVQAPQARAPARAPEQARAADAARVLRPTWPISPKSNRLLLRLVAAAVAAVAVAAAHSSSRAPIPSHSANC